MIGGETYNSSKLKSVELFNWKTSAVCDLPDLPFNISGMVGTVLNQTQFFCGGQTTVVQSKCYSLDLNSKTWIEVGVSSNVFFMVGRLFGKLFYFLITFFIM